MPQKEFFYEGDVKKWKVPKGVDRVRVYLDGGGDNNVPGGHVEGVLNTKNIDELYIRVGAGVRDNDGVQGAEQQYGGGGPGGRGKGHAGGSSGAGASSIRANSAGGQIKAVAGGAGGLSGDGSLGGRGGGEDGQVRAAWNPGKTTPARGGAGASGGKGGKSQVASALNGGDGENNTLGRGGAGGGDKDRADTYGGGGGGGGYRPGGGGAAGKMGNAPGGGGGGGSNYVGGLIAGTQISLVGGGMESTGRVVLQWGDPPPPNKAPNPPGDTKYLISGEWKNAEDDMTTRSVGEVTISATTSDPNDFQATTLVAYLFTDPVIPGTETVVNSGRWTAVADDPHQITFRGLTQNTRYHVHLYSQDSLGMRSASYTGLTFWTNRSPAEPDPRHPEENSMWQQTSAVEFVWDHNEPDGSLQAVWELRYRSAATPNSPSGGWVTLSGANAPATPDAGEPGIPAIQHRWHLVAAPGTFKGNLHYDWQVRTRDPEGLWGPWSLPISFFVEGTSTPPVPLAPVADSALDVTLPATFEWLFRDPTAGDVQSKADLRYRAAGTSDWFTLSGDTSTPGGSSDWTLPAELLLANVRYEWQVRTYDQAVGASSDWSESAYFNTVRTPGHLMSLLEIPLFTETQGSLGCGNNRVFIYDRGGLVMRGEITPCDRITWHRRRDDLGYVILNMNDFTPDAVALLSEARTWAHELVVFRDGERVFEGPITRILDKPDGVEIEAKDVMAWVYRRIMRQGYNDSYRKVSGTVARKVSIVDRAVQIIMNALAPDDPNILGYLTAFRFPDDAEQSRVVPDWSKTAWEEVDDLAATAGLDYTTVGRRILLWDTHRPIGRLPELRAKDFDSPPVITEYGMSLANTFGVTNNSGLYGYVERPRGPEGLIEQLASSYGETPAAGEEVVTAADLANAQAKLTAQADRNIASRWPTPIVVRVPDNSALSPDANVGINQLVPGVWIPLRAKGSIREVAQWQKLDAVTVEQTAAGEKVRVTLSPAPNAGEDPDADTAALEE